MDFIYNLWRGIVNYLELSGMPVPRDLISNLFKHISSYNVYLMYHCILVILIAFATSLFLTFIWRGRIKNVYNDLTSIKRALLVIAHPDDECMFFGPLVLHLLKTSKVHVVCLSSGNYYGNGEVRKYELWESCATLGINPNNIQLYKHDLLLDDPIDEWNPKLIAEIILNQIETLTIDVVISFDKNGVSGHKNHISIYNGLEYLRINNLFPSYCNCYVLNSVSLLRKFFGVMNILFDIPFSTYVLTCSYEEQKIIKQAMSKHASQYIWFRKMFMLFSRYTYINSFTRTS